jgi:hypothetical protein
VAYLRRRVLADGTPRFQVRGSTYEAGKRHYFSKEFASEREALAYLHGAAAKRERRGIVGGQSTLAHYVRDIWLPHLEAAGSFRKRRSSSTGPRSSGCCASSAICASIG